MVNLGIVGATGAVGTVLLRVLEERSFPVRNLRCFASERSRGKQLTFRGEPHEVHVITGGQANSFTDLDLVFFDASDDVSRTWVPAALSSGAWVVDNSAVYRMDPSVPLVVPEINAVKSFEQARASRLLAGPNCSTVQLVMALAPLRDLGLKRVVVTTFQSVSGAGAAAVNELKASTRSFLSGEPVVQSENFVDTMAFNCIPQIGKFQASGFTSEEEKIMGETRKILDLPNLPIVATAVRVPTLSAHAESVAVEFERSFSLSDVRARLESFSGVVVLDDPSRSLFPKNRTSFDSPHLASEGADAVFVGRLRQDPSIKNGLCFWVVSDNLRKGAALNAVQIGEALVRRADLHRTGKFR